MNMNIGECVPETHIGRYNIAGMSHITWKLIPVLTAVLLAIVFIPASYASNIDVRAGTRILMNEDFEYGSFIIDQPGYYKLGEDIVFNPNSVATLNRDIQNGNIPAEIAQRLGLSTPVRPSESGFPLQTQLVSEDSSDFTVGGPLDGRYERKAFSLGFFAAIVVKADNVTLDLAGYTIRQSEAHALLQRFFAVIETAEQPFIPNQGPADFGDRIVSANNLVIKNGVIGLSAHHGIHGNGNRGVRIHDVEFQDYEVAAIALNGVTDLFVARVSAENRNDVPVIGTFSSAQFIKQYLEYLVYRNSNTTLRVRGEVLDAKRILHNLTQAIDNVYEDIIDDNFILQGRASIDPFEHPDEFALFHNKHGVVDGNSYSFLINPLGVAVNGFPEYPDENNLSKNVIFNDVHINRQHAFINEVITLNKTGAVIDSVGAVFQLFNVHPENGAPITISSMALSKATYMGNPVANAQALVAKAILNGEFDGASIDVSRSNFTSEIINWVERKAGFRTLADIASEESALICNGDSMFHVNKGVIGFKIDGAKNVIINRTSVKDIVNFGQKGSSVCGDYSEHISHPLATLYGYGGAKARAYSFSGSNNLRLSNGVAERIKAHEGSVYGVSLLTDTKNVVLHDIIVKDVDAGNEVIGQYDLLNQSPLAVGVHVGPRVSKVIGLGFCATKLHGYGGQADIVDETQSARMLGNCR